MLHAGLIDAAVVGGVDSLCMTTLYGFHALELLSPDICRPWDVRRNGLSLGEGGGLSHCSSATPRRRWRGCSAAAKAATATT